MTSRFSSLLPRAPRPAPVPTPPASPTRAQAGTKQALSIIYGSSRPCKFLTAPRTKTGAPCASVLQFVINSKSWDLESSLPFGVCGAPAL